MWQLLIPAVGSILDKIFPDKTEADKAKARLLELQMNGELQQIVGQIEINKTEAANSNLFVSGWRPFVGWVCSAALAYEYLVRPLLTTFGVVAAPIEADTLTTLLFALLGIAGLRSVDKIKGVA